jgi:hypothetical protein
MSNEHLTSEHLTTEHLTTDPSLYPRIPDFPPPGEEDVVANGRGRNAKTGAVAGIVAAAALAVGIGVAVASNGSSAAQTAAGQQAAAAGQPGAQGGTGALGVPGGPGFGGRGGGGVDGEQRLTGTLTAVTAGSVTVRSTAGTATYQVNGTTQVTVNGAAGTLAGLKVGSTVMVHVLPSGSQLLAERIIVGDLGAGGAPAGPGTTT